MRRQERTQEVSARRGEYAQGEEVHRIAGRQEQRAEHNSSKRTGVHREPEILQFCLKHRTEQNTEATPIKPSFRPFEAVLVGGPHARRVFHAAPRSRHSRCEAWRPGKQAAGEAGARGRLSSSAKDRHSSASGRRLLCLRATPSAAVPHEGANWCDLASEDGDSLTERILFLAGGSHTASQPSHLSAAVPSVRSVPRWLFGG